MGEAGLGGWGPVDWGRDQPSARPARCSAVCPASPPLSALNFAVMSTAMNFGTKSFQPRPPDKGSFPLDHFGEAKRSEAQAAGGLELGGRVRGPESGWQRLGC